MSKPKSTRTKLPSESEAGFTDAVIELAMLHGWRVMHQRPAKTANGWRTAIQGHVGFPDLVLVKGERLIFAELKSAKGKLSADQAIWIARVIDAGAEGYIWRPADWRKIESELTREATR